ncbi:hypothetical protein NMG60_11030526 [Bertholletia excelsa]
MMISCVQPIWKNLTLVGFSSSPSSPFLKIVQTKPGRDSAHYNYLGNRRYCGKRVRIVCGGFLPVDPWAPTINSESIAPQLFALSLFPYIGFLFFITKSKSAPKLTLFGFYFLLAFVGATTVPAGIYAKVRYGTSLSNVDWLHGGAESLLTLTNLFIVMGLREALRRTRDEKENASNVVSSIKEEKKSSV